MLERAGTPLAIAHTGANCHDSEKAFRLVNKVPAIKQGRGLPGKRPEKVVADRAYDAEATIRTPLRKRSIQSLIAQRRMDHRSGFGKLRYVVEAGVNRLFGWCRRRLRYEKWPDVHEAFLFRGCAMICGNRITRFCQRLLNSVIGFG